MCWGSKKKFSDMESSQTFKLVVSKAIVDEIVVVRARLALTMTISSIITLLFSEKKDGGTMRGDRIEMRRKFFEVYDTLDSLFDS